MTILILGAALLSAAEIEESDPRPRPAVESGLLRFYQVGDKQCDFAVMPDDVRGTPAWKDGADNPPISARAAIARAAAVLPSVARQLPLDVETYGADPWGFESLKLVPLGSDDRWIWVVNYRAIGRSASAPAHHLELAVLMNGEVVKPKVKDKNPAR